MWGAELSSPCFLFFLGWTDVELSDVWTQSIDSCKINTGLFFLGFSLKAGRGVVLMVVISEIQMAPLTLKYITLHSSDACFCPKWLKIKAFKLHTAGRTRCHEKWTCDCPKQAAKRLLLLLEMRRKHVEWKQTSVRPHPSVRPQETWDCVTDLVCVNTQEQQKHSLRQISTSVLRYNL